VHPVVRIPVALIYGAVCHVLFAAGALTMVVVMWSGMQFGQGPWGGTVWGWLWNAGLVAQFVVGHSFFLSDRGRMWLARFAPTPVGRDMAPTTYAIIASVQIGLLFALWSPTGVVWFAPQGDLLLFCTLAFLGAWGLLGLSTTQAGLSLQSGLNGWWAVLLGRRTKYPPMPTRGLFAITRQPVYVSFALTTWTVPHWTPDQLFIALCLTTYCVVGPRFKEARMRARDGEAFDAYAARVPYWLPFPRPRATTDTNPLQTEATT